MNLNKLSGWQRLALVISAIYWGSAAAYSVSRGMHAPVIAMDGPKALPEIASLSAAAAVAATEAATAQAAAAPKAPPVAEDWTPVSTEPVGTEGAPAAPEAPAPSEGKPPTAAPQSAAAFLDAPPAAPKADPWTAGPASPISPAPARAAPQRKPMPSVDDILGPDPSKHRSAAQPVGPQPRRLPTADEAFGPQAPAGQFAFRTFAALMAVALAIYTAAAGLIWAGAGFRRHPVTQE